MTTMTPFERAVVAAYLARKQHGATSPEYEEALMQMEVERTASYLRGRRTETLGDDTPR